MVTLQELWPQPNGYYKSCDFLIQWQSDVIKNCQWPVYCLCDIRFISTISLFEFNLFLILISIHIQSGAKTDTVS